MISLKGPQDVKQLISGTIRDSGIENTGIDLRGIGTGSKEQNIKRIALQFEEMLINTLLKEAFKDDEKDDDNEDELPLSSGSYKDIRTMFLSQYIADSGGLGYREVIENQLSESLAGTTTEKKETAADPTPLPLSTVRTVTGVPHFPNASAVRKNAPAPGVPGTTASPVEGPVSSNYGWRKDPIDGQTRFHSGIDFDVPAHTPVKSFMDGEVTYSGWEKGYGYLVEVTHPGGYTTRYGHNSKLNVKEGDSVSAGDVIALSGSTGRSTGPHLHFEVRKGEFSLNPEKFLEPFNGEMLAKLK
jgi:murein DD-endopeptidase MepM/ murein hydrolase activator NlpD